MDVELLNFTGLFLDHYEQVTQNQYNISMFWKREPFRHSMRRSKARAGEILQTRWEDVHMCVGSGANILKLRDNCLLTL